MEGKCRSEHSIYKCVATATGQLRKAYLGTAEGDFKQRHYKHKKSIRYWKYANETLLSKYIWEMEDKHNTTPDLMWCTVTKVFQVIRISDEMYVVPTWKVWNLELFSSRGTFKHNVGPCIEVSTC